MTQQTQEKQLLKHCISFALDAGRLLMHHWTKRLSITQKKSYDLVTNADLAAEKSIIRSIHNYYPTHSVLCEESGLHKLSSDYLWIIDPLDGTNNYAHGIPHFSVSIAVAFRGNIIAGSVYAPIANELYSASIHTPALLNGNKIRVRTTADITQTILGVGFYYDRGGMMRRTLRQIQGAFEHKVRGIRRMGSAAIDLCWVASGRFGGFWEGKLSPWDYAAGQLIVERAGGKVTTLDNKKTGLEISSILAANPKMHKKLYGLFSGIT